MQIALDKNNANFGACYQIGKHYTVSQAKVAKAVGEIISTEAENRSTMQELESKGWDILIQEGKCLNSVSLLIAKGFTVGDSRYIKLKKEYIGEYYKGNLSKINRDIKDGAQKIDKKSNVIEHLLCAGAIILAALLVSSGLAKCSGSKNFAAKKADITAAAKNISERQGNIINLYK